MQNKLLKPTNSFGELLTLTLNEERTLLITRELKTLIKYSYVFPTDLTSRVMSKDINNSVTLTL
jgi:hypothetical protein